MNYNKLKREWIKEENHAFKGWDFSHIEGRWEIENLPWNYKKVLFSILNKTDKLLDIGTGGGEFILSLQHPHILTSITESYPPNIDLCKKELEPLGITVVETYDDNKLFFDNDNFDIVINRHASFDAKEVKRVLKTGGYFITQQVGGMNNSNLSKRLIKNFQPKFPLHTLKNNTDELKKAGFDILKAEEAFIPIRFFDIGALVYYAKVIEWEFPNFCVSTSFDSLCHCQEEMLNNGFVQGTEHRFIIVARKK